MKVLVTGAAGRVGKAVRREFEGHHELRLLDIVPIEEPGAECIVGDISDWDTACKAVEGMEGIVHLAFGQAPWVFGKKQGEYREWEVDAAGFDVNVKGTYWLLKAAVKAGIKRAAYASTLSIYDGNWPREGQVFDETVTPLPRDNYAITKYMGEELFRAFARHYGLPSICLRLTGVMTSEEIERAKNRGGTGWWRGVTNVRDVARAFRLALEHNNTGCDEIIICGDNADRQWDIGKARRILCFWPEKGYGPTGD